LNNFILFLRLSRGGLIFSIILRFKSALMLKKRLILSKYSTIPIQNLYNTYVYIYHTTLYLHMTHTYYLYILYIHMINTYYTYILPYPPYLPYPPNTTQYIHLPCSILRSIPNLPILRPYVLPIP